MKRLLIFGDKHWEWILLPAIKLLRRLLPISLPTQLYDHQPTDQHLPKTFSAQYLPADGMFHSQESEEKTLDNENDFESRLKKNFENCEEIDKVTV